MAAAVTPAASPATVEAGTPAAPAVTPNGTASGLAAQTASTEEFHTLANEFIKVTFTTRGGAIKEVALLKHADSLGSEKRYTFRAAPEDSAIDPTAL